MSCVQNAEGAFLAPFECWLAMRGLQTMALRMERQADTAQKLAVFLLNHPLVTKVNFPGLPGHRGYEINRRQASSGGSLLSFETGRCVCPAAGCVERGRFEVASNNGAAAPAQ